MKKITFGFPSIFKKRISPLLTQRFVRVMFFLPPIIVIVTLILIAFFYSQLPPQIPLYYSRPWGEDQLTQPLSLFILPLGSLIWYLVTTLVITFQTYQYRVFSQLLIIFSVLITILSAYSAGMILILVL